MLRNFSLTMFMMFVVIEQYLQEEKMPLIYRVKIKFVSWINPSLLEVKQSHLLLDLVRDLLTEFSLQIKYRKN
jgi:hypothetical protein